MKHKHVYAIPGLVLLVAAFLVTSVLAVSEEPAEFPDVRTLNKGITMVLVSPKGCSC